MPSADTSVALGNLAPEEPKQVFTTQDDEKVCEICQEYADEVYEEGDPDMPSIPEDTHPNCRCEYEESYNESVGKKMYKFKKDAKKKKKEFNDCHGDDGRFCSTGDGEATAGERISPTTYLKGDPNKIKVGDVVTIKSGTNEGWHLVVLDAGYKKIGTDGIPTGSNGKSAGDKLTYEGDLLDSGQVAWVWADNITKTGQAVHPDNIEEDDEGSYIYKPKSGVPTFAEAKNEANPAHDHKGKFTSIYDVSKQFLAAKQILQTRHGDGQVLVHRKPNQKLGGQMITTKHTKDNGETNTITHHVQTDDEKKWVLNPFVATTGYMGNTKSTFNSAMGEYLVKQGKIVTKKVGAKSKSGTATSPAAPTVPTATGK